MPTETRFATGIVSVAPSGGYLQAYVSGKDTADTIACARSVSAAVVGDQVLVAMNGAKSWAVGLLGTAPPPPAPAPTPNPAPLPPSPETTTTVTGSDPVSPVWTRTWRFGWRSDTTDLYQGDWSGRGINQGAAFFDQALRSLGTLTKLTLTLKREAGGDFSAQAPTMRLLQAFTPGGAYPNVVATATGPAMLIDGSAQWEVPSGWLSRLSDGGDCGGIGIGVAGASPYVHIDGPGLRAAADWTRSS